jgi:uncharacterized lipoprotein YddW (UPF0748 family)
MRGFPSISSFSRLVRVVSAVVLAMLPLTLHPAASAAPADDREEVRALWVQGSSLGTPDAITAMVRSARSSGFNTLLVQVRGRGDAYYLSRLEPRAAALLGQPADFDPLEDVISEARKANLRVHAWINVNLISNAGTLPIARDHLVYAHPEWLMVPRALAAELAGVDQRSPEYVGRLARFARAQPAEIEGLYVSPLQQASADHVVAVVGDLVSRYAVDGVHLDYVRFPNDEFDCSRQALALFRADLAPRLTDRERRQYDGLAAANPLAYVDAFPERWRDFRTSRLTAMIMRVRTAIKTRRPDVVLSVAITPDPREASTRRLQDWRTWVENKLVDVVCPMAYTTDPGAFRSQIETVRQLAGLQPVWAGIGAYRLSPSETIENILAARRLGAQGVILFSYDSLTRASSVVDYLSDVGRAAFNH